MTIIDTDAGRDHLEVAIRLDKVLLTVRGHAGAQAEAELTPAEARRLAELLAQSAGAAETTPRG